MSQYRDYPQIDNTSYIDSTAVVIGKVKIGRNVYIGPGVVIRVDEANSSVVIHSNCNIQDRVVIHALEGTHVEIGENTSLSHGCIVHGPCKIGDRCFIGFGAVIFNANLGNGVIVKHLAVVEEVKIPSKRIVPNGVVIDLKTGVKNLENVSRKLKIFAQKVVTANLKLVKKYKNV